MEGDVPERPSRPDQSPSDPFAVIDRVRAAFVDVPDEEIQVETDRILAQLRAETGVAVT